jgi:hypothetical protein
MNYDHLEKEIDGEAYYRLAMDFTTLEDLKHPISPEIHRQLPVYTVNRVL